MTYDEWTILQIAEAIKVRMQWENLCGGCKHLGDATWHFTDRTVKTHSCSHPDRQDGSHDPHPYGCNGHCYERK